MFGYSEQLDTCYEALVARGSPAELNQPPILKVAMCGLFSYTPPQNPEQTNVISAEILCAAPY